MLEFKNLEEKRASFFCQDPIATNFCGFENIDSFNDLLKIIELYKGKSNYIFRGINEAKYYITSSLQVKWDKDNLPQNQKLFDLYVLYSLWKFRRNLCNNPGINVDTENVDFDILSILQHYKKHTPLIDFSEDIYVSLLFMTKDYIPYNSSDNEINKYCSLYIINRSHSYWVNNTNLYLSANYDLGKKTDEYNRNSNNKVANIEDFTKYNKLDDVRAGIIIERNFVELSSKYLPSLKMGISSPRQDKQKGLFALNSTINTSLDKYMYNWYKSYPLIKCYNINKSIIPDIEKILNRKNYTYDNIYNLTNNKESQLYENFIDGLGILNPLEFYDTYIDYINDKDNTIIFHSFEDKNEFFCF